MRCSPTCSRSSAASTRGNSSGRAATATSISIISSRQGCSSRALRSRRRDSTSGAGPPPCSTTPSRISSSWATSITPPLPRRWQSDMTRQPLFEVRGSRVHGLGAFALRRIRKGTRIIEYLGERVSHQEADRRYESKDANDAHTFLFIVDSKTVIDAGVDGNDARFLNHSCNPNCESVIENRRVFIEAIRTIEPGEEMTYDYQIQREEDDPPGIDEVFACHCGFPQCRGTMLWPPDPPKPKRAKPKPKRPAAAKRARQAREGGRRPGKSGR